MASTEEHLKDKPSIIKRSRKVSGFKRYRDILRNGLFIFGLRNRLAKLGLDFSPYYWVLEESEPCQTPHVENENQYKVRLLSKEELKLVCHLGPGEEYDKMMSDLENGQWVVGLEINERIAAYTFVELNSFNFKGRAFNLKPNEVYLLNMWTFHEFRGKNLAPYLRYKTYELLREKGIQNKYSITDYFNKSSIKFKSKLKSKHLYLYLAIILFKNYTWNFVLRKY